MVVGDKVRPRIDTNLVGRRPELAGQLGVVTRVKLENEGGLTVNVTFHQPSIMQVFDAVPEQFHRVPPSLSVVSTDCDDE